MDGCWPFFLSVRMEKGRTWVIEFFFLNSAWVLRTGVNTAAVELKHCSTTVATYICCKDPYGTIHHRLRSCMVPPDLFFIH